MNTWRFIDYSEHDGLSNMAMDEAILQAHLEGLTAPTLRLYGFSPAAISLGLNQSIPSGLSERARSCGLQLIRRPTGGRAVLHIGDLTYSFVASSAHGDSVTSGILVTSVAGAYAQICLGLIEGLRLLGLEVQLGNSEANYRKLHDCFGATTRSDLHFKGKKIAGSAQLRRRNAVLQHGSILLNQDQDAMSGLLGIHQDSDLQRHANLFEVLAAVPSAESIHAALRLGFEVAFHAKFEKTDLTAYEVELANQLRKGAADMMSNASA